jgi:glucosamine kinase
MILVSESGSTKIDWKVAGSNNIYHSFTTDGFNPNYHPVSVLKNILNDLANKTDLSAIEKVFFYGSGCSSEFAQSKVKQSFRSVFPEAEVEVRHDLFGAARALFGAATGIAAILGTGSSSCLFIDGKIFSAVPSLGYLLADEGSGMDLGKRLLNLYFKDELPEKLSIEFDKKYHLTAADFLSQLYSHEKPNSLIASFVPFLVEHQRYPVFNEMIKKSFDSFFRNIILKYPACRDYPMGFVGSIAFLFSEILHHAAGKHGFIISKIIQSPIDELVRYHGGGE